MIVTDVRRECLVVKKRSCEEENVLGKIYEN